VSVVKAEIRDGMKIDWDVDDFYVYHYFAQVR